MRCVATEARDLSVPFRTECFDSRRIVGDLRCCKHLTYNKLDIEALSSPFKESKHKNTDLEVLKAAIRAQLEKLIRLNKTRAGFAKKFEELVKLSAEPDVDGGEI